MKVIISHSPTADADSYFKVSFPCSGVLKNMRMTIREPIANDGGDNWRFLFGDFNPAKVELSTPLVSGDEYWSSSRRDPKIFTAQMIDIDPVSDTGNGQYYFHSSKTMKVRHDAIYYFGIFGKTATAPVAILFEAEFLPYKNAYTKFSWTTDALADTINFDPANLGFYIPTGMRNAVLEYDIYVDNASEVSFRIIPRIIRSNRVVEEPSTPITGYGIIDSAVAPTGDVRFGNTMDGFLVGSASSGVGSAQGVVPIRDILRAGDYLTFDVESIKGTVTGIKATLTLHGRAIGERLKTKSNFVEGSEIVQPLKETSM